MEELDYVKLLADKMEKEGFTIPAKDLTNPAIAKELYQATIMFEMGATAPFIDWSYLSNTQLIEVGRDLESQLIKARVELAKLRITKEGIPFE